jgi:hypothetical protein
MGSQNSVLKNIKIYSYGMDMSKEWQITGGNICGLVEWMLPWRKSETRRVR